LTWLKSEIRYFVNFDDCVLCESIFWSKSVQHSTPKLIKKTPHENLLTIWQEKLANQRSLEMYQLSNFPNNMWVTINDLVCIELYDLTSITYLANIIIRKNAVIILSTNGTSLETSRAHDTCGFNCHFSSLF